MKKASKQKGRVEPKSNTPYKRRAEEDMVKIVQEIQSGLLTIDLPVSNTVLNPLRP